MFRAADGGRGSELVGRESDQDWFRRSRLCAFEADHRGCLRTAYCALIALLSGGYAPPACDDQAGDYLAASSISSFGFAKNRGLPTCTRFVRPSWHR